MKIDIQNNLVEVDQALEVNIHRRLRLALSKMESNISTITFNISDVIGKNGNHDKHCLLTISISGMSSIVVEETQTELDYAIARVIQKASRNVSRKLSQ